LHFLGIYKRKPAGSLHSVKKAKDDFVTLDDLRFVIGDILDVNIIN
jgi:uncharacterized protein Usg